MSRRPGRLQVMAQLMALLLALPAWAADYPALYAVAGVAANDTLNVRAAPSASAPVLGTLAPDAAGIEVTEASGDGRWGRVNIGERSGWTSLRYLRRTTPPLTALNRPMRCFGTEPFWSLELDGAAGASFAPVGSPVTGYTLMGRTASANRTDRLGFVATREGGAMFGALSLQACSDGMSDRRFGISIEAVTHHSEGFTQFSGCCTLAPN